MGQPGLSSLSLGWPTLHFTMPRRAAPTKIADEAFVAAWEACPTVQMVAETLGIGRRACISRAFRLRKAGVNLTRKPRSVPRSKAHLQKLNRLIQKRP